MTLRDRSKRAGARFLDREVAGDRLKVPNEMARLYERIRRGDVVLVEGKLRISQLVKYATRSPWSHSALSAPSRPGPSRRAWDVALTFR
jgi:hypothetical protein